MKPHELIITTALFSPTLQFKNTSLVLSLAHIRGGLTQNQEQTWFTMATTATITTTTSRLCSSGKIIPIFRQRGGEIERKIGEYRDVGTKADRVEVSQSYFQDDVVAYVMHPIFFYLYTINEYDNRNKSFSGVLLCKGSGESSNPARDDIHEQRRLATFRFITSTV